MSGLLATKLHRPSVPKKRVQRPHLIQRLNEGLASGRQLTLISAPAGFGKTTCISEWVDTLDVPVTWLSLDPADDDPGRFFTYLVAALQQVDASLGREIEGVLRAGQLPPVEIIVTTLINDILEMELRFLLILDDFQVIQDRVVLQVLEQLMDHQLQPLHLVLLTREDPSLPLARLRANNQLTEIRAGDLRFSIREADRFLNDLMGLSLSQTDVAVLEDRTEGWIAGLQLAGLSMRGREDPSHFISSLSGSHRFILSYLSEEVLSRQPEHIQRFLLQTSILDRLNGDLCNAVTGRADSHSLLEQLFAANLFLIPLDDEGHWYRYHHLFADLLRNLQSAFQKDKTAELHRQASRWYAQAGLMSEAITHALAAADYELAVHLLEGHATGLLTQGYVKAVEGWLNAIPPESRSQSPRTNLAFAWMHLIRGTLSQAIPYLERLQALFSGSQIDEKDSSLMAEWLALQSYLLTARGKPDEGLELANQALAIASEADDHVRSLAGNALGSAYLQLNDYSQAVDVYRKAILHGRTAGNIASEVMGMTVLTQIALQRGELRAAFEVAAPGVERLEHIGSPPPISAVVYGALGQVHYQWHQIEQARRHILRAIKLCSLGGYTDGEIYHRALLSRLLHLEGNLDAADQEIQKAIDLMQARVPAWGWEEAVSQQVHIHLAQNRLAAAEAVLAGQGFSFQDEFSFPELAPGQEVTYPVGRLYNSALRILLYRAQTKGEMASMRPGIELANRLISGALQGRYLPTALETLLLRAQMHAALGNHRASLADVTKALDLAEPEGFICIFAEEGSPIAEALASLHRQNLPGAVQSDYIKNVLAAFPQTQPPYATHREQSVPTLPVAMGELPVEPLTPRELEVLQLIAAGDSNQTIADKLVITARTVKKHTGNIYGKLNVGSRTQAIARARQLGLLPTDG